MQRIVIVSEDTNLLNGVKNHLNQKNDNIELKGASSTTEAIQKIKDNQFDVIVSEYKTSSIDGSKLYKKMHEEEIQIPYIMLLNNTQQEVYSQVLSLGVDYCIINPDNLEILTCEINHIIQKVISLKTTEDALREANNRYFSLMDQSLQAEIIIQNDKVAYSNSVAENLLGYTKKELSRFSSKDFFNLIHPEDQKFTLSRIQARLDGKTVTSRYECRLIKKSGDICWVNLFSTPVEFNGQPAIQTTSIDITDQKQTEDMLKKEREKAQHYLDISSVVIVALNNEGIVTLINKKGCELLGYSNDEIVGENWFDTVIPEQYRADVREVYNSLMLGEIEPVKYYENSVLTKSGEERLVAWHNTVYKDEKGDIIGTLGSAQDITIQKQKELELAREKELSEILINEMPCIAMLLKPRTREIVASNKHAVEVGAIPGKKCYETWGQRQDPCPWCLAPKAWKTGKEQHVEVEALNIVWDAHWIPITDDLYLHYAFDITEKRKIEEKLKESEYLLNSILKNMPVLLYRVDKDGFFTLSRGAALHRLGLKENEAVGLNVFEAYERHGKYFTKALAGETLRFEEQDIVNDKLWAFLTFLFPDEITGSGTIGFAIDITERVEAEQKSRENEELFTQFMDYLPAAAFIKDKNSVTIFANKYLKDVFGGETWIGKSTAELFPEKIAKQMMAADKKVLKNGLQVIIEELTDVNNVAKTYQTLKFPIKRKDKANLLGGIALDITDQREVETKFQEIFNKVTDAIILTDPSTQPGTFLEVNDAFVERIGYTRKELLNMSTADTFTGKTDPPLPVIYDTLNKVGFIAFETEDITKDGTHIPIEIRTHKIILGGKDILLSVSRDITDRKKAEKEVRNYSEQLELIVDNFPGLIFYKDNQNNFIRVNELIAAAHHMTKEELIGKSLFDLYPKEEAQAYWEDDLEVIESGEAKLSFEEKWETSKGIKWVTTSKVPLKDEKGDVTGIIGFSIDTTEQKRMVEKLQVSEEKYRLIVETSQEGIVILDEKANLTFVNPRMEEMLGYSMENLLNHSIFEFMDPNLINNVKMIFESFKKSVKDFSEIKLSRRDGTDLWVLFNSSSIYSAEGKLMGVLGMLTDISEDKKREEETLNRLMKFNIKKSNLYLTIETTPTLAVSVINDMSRLGYYTLIFSRTQKSDLGEDFYCEEFIWLSEKGEEDTILYPSLDILASSLEKIPRNSIILFDRLDYLISKYGFKDTLKFVYKLKDIAIIRNLIILLSIDPDTITRRKLKLLEKETKPIESKFLAQLSHEILQLLRYIYRLNKSGIKPSYSNIGNSLKLSRPTTRKKIKQLIVTGYINEQRSGNQKILELTEKGLSLFIT
ncbi:MAG: PAS domain S-box protein [Candidatus Hodarchaeales archaeon]|jgi:PAS domain S-box-containing protein